MDLKKNIGRLIAHARIIKGLTQKQLAERIGVSESAIGNYEASGRLPETSILILLCKELDLLPVELFSGKRFHNAEARKELLKMLNESTGKIEMPNEEESTEPSKKDDQGEDLSKYQTVYISKNGDFAAFVPNGEQDLCTVEELESLRDRFNI